MADIFKLIFEHDLRLDALRERSAVKKGQKTESTLADFLKPDPTYSKFYLTGTRIKDQKFGLNTLSSFPAVRRVLRQVTGERHTVIEGKKQHIDYFLDEIPIGVPAVISANEQPDVKFDALKIDKESNIGHKKDELRDVLKSGNWVLYKENNHHGYDLHLFSKENIYPQLFYPFRELVSDEFRFFSMNGKRITSERKFYFETWTLQRPPHGAEEVYPETEI